MDVNTTYEPYAEEPEYIDTNRALLESLSLGNVKMVLDLACGTGLLSDLLMQVKPGLMICGVDISRESLDIGRRQLSEKGLLAADLSDLMQRGADGRGGMFMQECSADALPFDAESFDMAMMGNAIHLMPDKDKFLQGVHRVLKPGAPFVFNSVFYTGTFVKGTEYIYTEWMKEAVAVLAEKNAERAAQGLPPIPRQRGKAGKAFDKGWLSAEGWTEVLERNGFKVQRTGDRTMPISQRGLELVGAYGGLAEVLMSGYPVEVASECLQAAVGRAFRNLNVTEAPRNWLEVIATRV